MIITDLIKQNWLKDFRSQSFYKDVAVKIFVGIMAVYFIVLFLFIGLFLGDMLNEASPTLKPLEIFNGATLYILLGGVMMRFLMMQLNTLNLQTYQSLPIKRTTLVNFILLKPLFSAISYLTLLMVVPFAVRSVSAYYSGAVALRFVLNFILLIWFNTLLASYLKRRFGASLWALPVFLVIIGGFAALEYFKVFSLFDVSMRVFNFVVIHPVGLLVSLIGVFAAYGINRLFFAQNYYPEKFNEKLKDNHVTANRSFSFLEKYGTVGELIALQLRLIFRHKRTKSMMYMSVAFLFYGLIFYKKDMYENSYGMLFFAAIFVTGIAMIMYGQWIISWESSYFDSLLTKNIPVKTYMRANFYLLMAFNVMSFILTTPYFFLGTKIIYLHLAAFLYNTGVNISLFLFFSPFNTKRIDLNAKGSFNYQGTTYKSFLIVQPILFVPMLTMFLASTFGKPYLGLIIMGSLGLMGFLFREKIMDLTVKLFNKRKYLMAQGFRETA